MASDAAPTKTPAADPPAPPPAADASKTARQPKIKDVPVPDGRGGYILPRSIKNADLSGLSPRDEDTGCPECGSPLFARVDVVRMAQGYTGQGGQKRGVLLVCLGCGEALNGHEVKDW